jgi:hypothetical protein
MFVSVIPPHYDAWTWLIAVPSGACYFFGHDDCWFLLGNYSTSKGEPRLDP